ncbi:S-layer homology domain-containing protein [Paenibacillus tianjinensis]|uniref:S-layer homology domain-containing protein n=1 Tax=Paenibacillus tianjinensis TaxID=2810347 RepID=A0ABX7L7C8_9BACL|nr:S-layer homology domain-containing protein [Paenibacillus tianjinensis]QSF44105.1 S-layer homology domain-containing protein [Paenibacillus tianjinensis]
MYSKRFRMAVSVVLVFLLAFINVLGVSAASLKAGMASNELSPDGKQKITVNSVVDVTYKDLKVLQEVKFILTKGETEIARQVKPKSEAKLTAVDAVYNSLEYSSIPFEGLTAGEEYSLRAEFEGEQGTVVTLPQIIRVPSTTGINIAVEVMAKDSNTYVSATNGEIRSDDKNVRLTISNNGVPLANESLAISLNYSYYTFTTDANGQIQLRDKISSTISTSVLFVLLKQGTDQYEAKPIYVTDLQQAGTYTVAIRYLDAAGKQLRNYNSNTSWPNGIVNRYGVSGIDVLVLRTGEVSGNYTGYVTTDDGAYLFQTGQAALYSSVSGVHKEIIEDGSDYSRLSLHYTWDNKPVQLESYSLIDNNQYKQINGGYNNKKLTSPVIYVKKNKEYEITAVGTVQGVDGKVVFRNRVKPTEAAVEVTTAANPADYSALKLQVPQQSAGVGQVLVSYLNDRLNYSQISTTLPAANGTLYVRKGEEIHRLTATVAPSAAGQSNSANQIVLKAFFKPAESEYTLKGGSTYTTKINVVVPDTSYYGKDELRNQVVLGESVQNQVVMTDEYGNIIDLNGSYRFSIVDESGTVLANDSLSWTTREKDGHLERINMRDWKPVTAGTYKVQFSPYTYSNGQYVNGEPLAEAVLKVLPKNEFDVEIRGKDGKLVDLVEKPYLTVDQAQNVTITVRQHVTGGQGELQAGVEISRYGQALGVTDAQGKFTIPSDQTYYIGELMFKKPGFLFKKVKAAVINPATQAVIRVRGLDKAEGSSYAGGVPLDYASVQAVVKSQDGSYQGDSYFINTSEAQAILVVDSPSVVGVDFIRYNRSYTGVESKFGYYMYGSVRTEPGKDYSLVLDARQELQEVSKVLLDRPAEDLSVVRADLAGANNVPYVIDSNAVKENYFYATQGTYSMLAQTASDTFIYRDGVVIGAGDNTLTLDDSASGLATLVAPESGTIYSVEYSTPNQSTLKSYAYNADQVRLTPGDVTVQVDKAFGTIEYQYDIHFAPGTLKAGTLTELAPQTIQGLDIVGLKDGKLKRPAGVNWLTIGLVDTAGNQIGQIKKPQILVISNGGWSNGYKYVTPEAASYEIQDESGRTLYSDSSVSYPLTAYTFNTLGENVGYLTNGTYIIKASLTIDGKNYTLNKKVVLETTTGTVVDPGTDLPGTDVGNGDGSGTGNSNGNGNGNGTGSGTETGTGTVTPTPSPTPTPTAANVTENVEKQNNKLEELLTNTTGSAVERAAAAQTALTSIADSLKSATTSAEAEQNSKSLSKAMDTAAGLLATIQDSAAKQKIVDSITELVGSAPYLLNKMDSSDKAVSLAHTLIENAAAVLNNVQGVAAEDIQKLKNSVISSSQTALNKAGEVTIAKANVTVAGNTVSSKLDETLISTQIQSAKLALSDLSKDLTSKLGTGSAAELKVSITVNVPPVEEGIHKLNTTLPSEILTLVKENDVAGLKIQMDQTAFTLEPDTFGTVEAGQTINLAAEVVENAVVSKPSQAEPLASIPVMEFSASVGGQQVKSFAKPIEVTFDVSSIDTSKYSGANLENLTVYLLNNESLTWEAVGGKYDPVTQTVTTPRGHFSRYTVMLGKASFTDVSANHWAVQEINYLLNKGILDQSAVFRPSDKVTRQEFAAMIARAYGLSGEGLLLPFKDISSSNPYYDEIAAAYAAGIITGKSANAFDPKATITREEIATMLARALTAYNGKQAVSQPESVNATFTDKAKISKWAAASVALTKSIQLFEGFEDHSFRPAQTASKAEAAALIYRLYQLK